jgi:hypothetical protein
MEAETMSDLRSRAVLAAVAACIALCVLAPFAARAGTTGSIQGFVTDANGHAIVGADISVVSPTFSTRTVTGPNGFYAVNGLPVDTYRVAFSKEGFQAQVLAGITVVQDQAVRLDGRLAAEALKTLAHVSVRGQSSIVQPTQTSDTYTVNQNLMDNINGTPQDPNGFNAIEALPGITTDNTGFPTIRAGASNDVGYEYDGVDNTDVVTGEFLNGLSLNGARSIQLSTGGYDVSNGNTNSGVINQVVKRGAYPGAGQATIRVSSELYSHELSFDYGNATPDNRFSYYISYGGQRDGQGYGDLRSTLPLTVGWDTYASTDDDVANLFYHFGKNNEDEIQLLSDTTSVSDLFGNLVNQNIAPYATDNGDVQYGTEIFTDRAGDTLPVFASDFTTLFPGQVALDQTIGLTDTQNYNSQISKLAFKRQLTASSFADVRLFQTRENWVNRYPYDAGSFTDEYFNLQTLGTGVGFDYDSQLSAAHSIGIGGDYTYYNSLVYGGIPSLEPFDAPLEAYYISPLNAELNAALIAMHERHQAIYPTDPSQAPLTQYPSDFNYTNDPVERADLFAKDLYQPNARFTADVGLRYDTEIYRLPADAASQNFSYVVDDAGNYDMVPGATIGPDVTRPSQISPRAALSYQVDPKDVIRFSYGKNIEFEPESGIENKYVVPASYANCNIADGCFVPLQGYSATCANGFDPANGDVRCNNISNLYQQTIIDENTNNFASYTPVLPQRAVNADFSIEHEFPDSLELKISPYYRKGTDYVVGTSSLLFTLPSGKPIFGPAHETNAGVNENTGVEFDLQKESASGLDGFLNFTYDNTLANYDSDYFPTVNDAALAAGHFFHVDYVAPVTGNLNLSYDTPGGQGWHLAVEVPYESGYRYGVGKKLFIFANACDPTKPAIPVEVLNTDVAEECSGGTTSDAYYFTDPTNPGTAFAPIITGSRGTPEGDDPGSLLGNPIALVNIEIAHDIGKGANNFIAGFRVDNLLGNYTLNQPGNFGSNNPFYINNGLGGYGPGSGNNYDACTTPGQTFGCEPFSYNYSALPYENEPAGAQPRQFTFFLSAKY